jgi:NodT family efflux transporter outer membrane factor (OMF) lipoprotein
MTRPTRRPRLSPAALAAATALFALAACMAPPEEVPPPVRLPDRFSTGGEAATPDRWWTTFGDAALDALVDRALAGNLDLRAAWDRLDQAEASARKAGAGLWPSLTAEAGAGRTRSATVPAGGGRRTFATRDDFSLGLLAGYEIDLWGRVRATRDAAGLAALAGREDLDAAAITLAAEVAAAWYRLLDQRGQIRILDAQIRTNEDYLDLVTFRFRQGQGSAVDVLQQRQLLESTRAERHRAEAERQVLEHRLAILVGEPPDAPVTAPGDALPDLPPTPATGLPADLIRKRPDVRASWLRLSQADAAAAAAAADRWPRLSLSARAETSADDVRDLFDNWLAGLAASLVAPLFEGGARQAEAERAEAAAAERLHAYGQAILDALGEVEDALVRERRQRDVLASLERQLALSSAAVAQTRERYAKGAADYLRVLTVLLSNQRLERDTLRARRELLGHRIDLHRALGGGWGMVRPGTESAPGNEPEEEPVP